jgi:hypothetical protein
MKDFQKIDWKQFNRPPYYQQWLCRDDTLKLATFGDRGLVEIDDQIFALKDQWDLDNVKGSFLDRIGKLLSEARNGNTDEYYRILLKLRRLLNTNNGSIPSIIKAIKFIYSSEVVHIVPNYPAGLIIEHDGEGTSGLNFNKLLAEIIPAGVSFSTKELFSFLESLRFVDEEEFNKLLIWHHTDIFTDTVYRNGRVLRDGHTVRDWQFEALYRNGAVFRNGSVVRNGIQMAPAVGRIVPPIFRHSGIQDMLEIVQGDHATENWKSNVFRNGAFLRDGNIVRRPQTAHFNDIIYFGNWALQLTDNFPFVDDHEVEIQPRLTDDIGRHYKRDGRHLRNAAIYRSSERIIDIQEMQVAGLAFIDEGRVRLVRNGFVKRNGAEFRSGHAVSRSMMDRVDVGYYLHHFRNGAYNRNGETLRNAMIYIPT